MGNTINMSSNISVPEVMIAMVNSFYGSDCEPPVWVVESKTGDGLRSIEGCFKDLEEVKKFVAKRKEKLIIYRIESVYLYVNKAWEECVKRCTNEGKSRNECEWLCFNELDHCLDS